MKTFGTLLVLSGLLLGYSTVSSQTPRSSAAATTDGRAYAFVGGLWYDGESFAPRTVYVVDGRLMSSAPARVDSTIDLDGRWVVPPYGEAHTHTLLYRRSRIGDFLQRGIFYALVMNAHRSVVESVRDSFGGPASVDAGFALAGITAPSAHPVQIGLRGGSTEAEIDGDWLTLLRDRRDLDAKWDNLASSGTDLVKVFLVYSEEYEQRKDDPAVPMRYRGMDPGLVSEVARRAHEAGLRVAAHVESAADFHAAVAGDVDIVAHLPGFAMAPNPDTLDDPRRLAEIADPERYAIDPADARLAAERGIVVQTTVSGVEEIELDPEIPEEARARLRPYIGSLLGLVMRNLRLLKESGVEVVLASDAGERDVVDEALFVHGLDVWTTPELFKILVETTPRSIFPDRRIGRLDDGFEASFLVLGANPLEDFRGITDIRLRVKDGRLLTLPVAGGETIP